MHSSKHTNRKESDMKITDGQKILAVLALVVLGQTLAFDDEMAQNTRSCGVATYEADNKWECENATE